MNFGTWLDNAITTIAMNSSKNWFCGTVGELERFAKKAGYTRTLHHLQLATGAFLSERAERLELLKEIRENGPA